MKKPVSGIMLTMLLIGMLALVLSIQPIARASTINILALDTSTFDTQILSALSGVTFTEVSPDDFMSVDLSAFDVLYVASTFKEGSVTIPSQAALDALNARKDDVASFVKSGHGLIALSEPIGTGCYTWIPVMVAGSGVLHKDTVKIIEPEHSVMDGLTDAGLSDWGSSYHNVFIDTGPLTALTIGIDFGSLPVTLAGTFGSGRIVLTGQDPDYHYVYGPQKQQAKFLQNAVSWVAKLKAVGGISIPLNKLGLLALYIGLASTIIVATVATSIYVKHAKRRKEKQ